jgi:hypothetical protein
MTPECSKGDGVAQGFDGWDAVLPLVACWSAQGIGRPRLQRQEECFSLFILGMAKPQPAASQERNTHHDRPEAGRVAVPTDARPKAIFGNQDLDELLLVDLRECGRLATQLVAWPSPRACAPQRIRPPGFVRLALAPRLPR